MSSRGLQRFQGVCSVFKGSAAFSRGLRRFQGICGVFKGSAAFSRGLRRFQGICGVFKGSAAFSRGLRRFQGVCGVFKGSAFLGVCALLGLRSLFSKHASQDTSRKQKMSADGCKLFYRVDNSFCLV